MTRLPLLRCDIIGRSKGLDLRRLRLIGVSTTTDSAVIDRYQLSRQLISMIPYPKYALFVCFLQQLLLI